MKKTIMILMVGALLIAGGGAGIVSAQADEAQTGYGWYGPMHNWMVDHMRGFGYGPGSGGLGYCGAYYGYDSANGATEVTVETRQDAFEIAKKEIDSDVSEENIYQMGRWWAVYYTDDNGAIKQGRIDAFTGEVIEDISNLTNNYQPRANTRGYGGGMGYGMMYGY